MSRHTICQAIVLHQQSIGEIHALLTLLTPDQGLVKAMGHGLRGAKSSLRSKCQTYSLINAFLFEDTQKKLTKLSDAEVLEDFFALRENLTALYHAAAMAEILKRSPLNPDEGWAFSLYLLALECLSRRQAPDGIRLVTLQFLWRYLGFTGYQPDPSRCMVSMTLLEADEATRYQSELGGFVSAHHEESTKQNHRNRPGFHIPGDAMAWLRHTARQEFETACEVGLSLEEQSCLLLLLFDLVADLLGGRLQSIQGQEFLFFS